MERAKQDKKQAEKRVELAEKDVEIAELRHKEEQFKREEAETEVEVIKDAIAFREKMRAPKAAQTQTEILESLEVYDIYEDAREVLKMKPDPVADL